jgi:hypothetical protein
MKLIDYLMVRVRSHLDLLRDLLMQDSNLIFQGEKQFLNPVLHYLLTLPAEVAVGRADDIF